MFHSWCLLLEFQCVLNCLCRAPNLNSSAEVHYPSSGIGSAPWGGSYYAHTSEVCYYYIWYIMYGCVSFFSWCRRDTIKKKVHSFRAKILHSWPWILVLVLNYYVFIFLLNTLYDTYVINFCLLPLRHLVSIFFSFRI